MQLAASGLDVLHCGMHGRSEEKRNSHLFEAGGDLRRRQADVHAQGLHHIGGAALRGDAAIAMFGDAHAGAGDDEGCRRRDVEGSAGITAGATGVNESIPASAASVENRVGVKFKRNGGSANGFGESDNFFDRLTFHVQRHQKRGNLGVRALTGENFRHDGARFFASERLAVIGDAVERVEDHG